MTCLQLKHLGVHLHGLDTLKHLGVHLHGLDTLKHLGVHCSYFSLVYVYFDSTILSKLCWLRFKIDEMYNEQTDKQTQSQSQKFIKKFSLHRTSKHMQHTLIFIEKLKKMSTHMTVLLLPTVDMNCNLCKYCSWPDLCKLFMTWPVYIAYDLTCVHCSWPDLCTLLMTWPVYIVHHLTCVHCLWPDLCTLLMTWPVYIAYDLSCVHCLWPAAHDLTCVHCS